MKGGIFLFTRTFQNPVLRSFFYSGVFISFDLFLFHLFSVTILVTLSIKYCSLYHKKNSVKRDILHFCLVSYSFSTKINVEALIKLQENSIQISISFIFVKLKLKHYECNLCESKLYIFK